MIDWSLVKKIALWAYEDLIKQILDVFSYSFVKEYYNHDMSEAIDYVRELLGYNPKYARFISKTTYTLKSLESLRVENYTDLILKVENKVKCENFLRKAQLSFEDFISSLNYIFRWVLPHKLYLRELIDTKNETQRSHIDKLRKHKTRFNLEILEYGQTGEGRERLAKETGIPKSFILDLVNLADMSRLPYSNRKTVKHLSAGGFDSVAKLAQVDSERLSEIMKSYFEQKGIKLSGFVDLNGITQWAKTIPSIVKD